MKSDFDLRSVFFMVVFGTALQLVAPAAEAQQSQRGEARVQFLRGRKLYAAQDYAGAFEAYRRSHRLRPNYDAAGNAGQAAFRLERWRDACNYVSYSLEHMPASMNQRRRAEIESQMRETLASTLMHVGRIRIIAKEGTKLYLDNSVIGTVPLDPDAYCASVGTHTVRAELTRHVSTTRSVKVLVGETTVLQLRLAKPPVAELDSRTRSPNEPNDKTSGAPSAAVWVPLGIGAIAGIAVGVGLNVSAGAKLTEADTQYGELQAQSPCVAGGSMLTTCQHVADLLADGDTLRAGGVASLAIGGALGVVALTYGLWPREDDDKALAVDMVVPLAVPGFGGVVAGGVF